MDDRQQQIRDRAGLDESRVNQEFVDLLKKYSTPALLVLALIVGGYAGWQRWQQAKAQKVADAFRDLEAVSNAAGGIPSPNSLIDVAEQYEGVGAVSALARLEAADACLAIARSGIEPGAVYNQDGTLSDPNAVLDDEAKAGYLSRAHALYSDVLATTAGVEAKKMIAVNALFGLAAVEESRGDFEQAQQRYEAIVERTEGTTFTLHRTLARERLATMGRLEAVAALPSDADLPKPPAPETPAAAPVDPAGPAMPEAPSAGEGGEQPAGQPTGEPAGQPGGETPAGGSGGETGGGR